MSPSEIRGRLEKANAEIRLLEQDLVEWGRQGATLASPVRFEVTEASEALERAVEVLDQSYKSAS